jgi:hypothetical protein
MTRIYINNHEPSFPHLVHIVLTLLTCGAWLPVYVLCYVLGVGRG